MMNNGLLNRNRLKEYNFLNLLIVLTYILFLLTFIISREYELLLLIPTALGIMFKMFDGFNIKAKEIIIMISITVGSYIAYRSLTLGYLGLLLGIISGLILFETYNLLNHAHLPTKKERVNVNESILLFDFSKQGYLFAVSFAIGLSLLLSTFLGVISGFRLVFGSLLILFLPGFLLSYVFFSKNTLGTLERIAASFALSITSTPFIIFYSSLLGFRINTVNSLFVIAIQCIVVMIWLAWKKKL